MRQRMDAIWDPNRFPVRWVRGFGWGTWRAVWRIVFPGWPRPIPGYTLLPVRGAGSWWQWPALKLYRLRVAMRGPV